MMRYQAVPYAMFLGFVGSTSEERLTSSSRMQNGGWPRNFGKTSLPWFETSFQGRVLADYVRTPNA
jgi:hypothetical protein